MMKCRANDERMTKASHSGLTDQAGEASEDVFSTFSVLRNERVLE